MEEKTIISGNQNHIIAVILNEHNIEQLTSQLKRSSFPMQQVYKVIPYEKQYFAYILNDLEIPDYRIDFYTSCLKHGKHLLVINSTEYQARQAQSILNYLGIKNWEVYSKFEAYRLTSSNFDKVSLS